MSAESALPDGLEQGFQVAAGELGMSTASWLFLREVAAAGGDALITELRDRLGRSYPVLDAVALAWLSGAREPRTDPSRVVEVCQRADRLLIVGLEAAFLDVLLPRLDSRVKVALLKRSPFEVDWDRVVANYPHVTLLDLDVFQRWAGPRSVLLTFAYGIHGPHAHVLPGWLRVIGEDVRTQFRSIVAWDVLGTQMFVFPRWLVEASTESFTHLISP